MSKVMSIASGFVGATTKLKPMEKLADVFNSNLSKGLALTTVSSVVVKDGVGCLMYVEQSKHNKKIPDERRKFVTAMDLTNGILMMALQVMMFFAVRKVSEPMFNKLFQKSFSPANEKILTSRIRMIQKSGHETVSRKQSIDKSYRKVRKDALDIFKFVTDLSAATIIGKRVLVPFIATPLADKVKNRMEAKEAAENTEPIGQKLDVVSSETSNLLEQYRLTARQK